MTRVFATIAVLFGLSACAPTLGVQGKFSPASGLPPGVYRTITVVPFSGFGGPALSRDIEARLATAQFEGKPYFNLVPAPPGLTGSDIDGAVAIELGQRLGIDAVLAGRASTWTNTIPTVEYRDVCVQTDAKGKCTSVVREQIRCEDLSVDVTISPRLIDARTGQIVYAKESRGSARDRRCDALGLTAFESQLQAQAREEALRDIRFDLAPFERRIDAELKDSTDGLTPEQKTIFKQGMEFAKAENAARACDLWRGLKDQGANTLPLAFNLGVCAEAAGDYDSALRIYEGLERGLAKPDEDIAAALIRVRTLMAERNKLKAR